MSFPLSSIKNDSTQGAISISIDYNDPSAVDPPAGMRIRTQAEADAILNGNPGKHVAAWFDAMPTLLRHAITITLASGVHRPRPADTAYAWDFSGKLLDTSGSFTLSGAASSTWDPYGALSALVVDSKTATTSTDPYLDFSATNPGIFTGLNLAGMHVVSNSGEVATIRRNTNDRLYTTTNFTTAATATVAWPSTILRNSAADVTAQATAGAIRLGFQKVGSRPPLFPSDAQTFISNLRVDGFDSGSSFYHLQIEGSNFQYLTNCQFDFIKQAADFGVTVGGRVINNFAAPASNAYLFTCGMRATPGVGNTQEPLYGNGGSSNGMFGSVVYGLKGYVWQTGGSFFMQNSAIVDCGLSKGTALWVENAELFLQQTTAYSQGCNPQVLGEKVVLINTRHYAPAAGGYLGIGNCPAGTDGALELRGKCDIDFSAGGALGGIRDLGGNACDYGIIISGSRNDLAINTATDLTGVVDDLQVDGASVAYTDIVGTAASPDITANLNTIGRG